MTFLDIAKIALTIIGSIGGGGAIILGLSSFLGRLWADRAQEKQRHEYALLAQQTQHHLETALKRYESELSKLGLIHSLRTQEEFTHIHALWKNITKLGFALREMITAEILFQATQTAPHEKWNEYKAEFVDAYKSALDDSQHFLAEQMIFIPGTIAEVALDIVQGLLAEHLHYIAGVWIHQPEAAEGYSAHRQNVWNDFNEKSKTLEQLIRTYIQSEARLEVPTRYTI